MQKLSELLERLVRDGSVSARAFDAMPVRPRELGLPVDGARVLAPPHIEMLDAKRIGAALSPAALAWLRDLQVRLVVDSTNTRMAAAARSGSIDGSCWFAELQTSGRGRRERRWISPFARNLAVSMGFALGGSPNDAGALSLAVGLAAADLIEGLGLDDVAVKWPNDVLIGGAKVCGILIELIAPQGPLECVVGVGLNLCIPAEVRTLIDQEVADLAQFGVAVDRDVLAAGLVSNVVRFVDEFKRAGFAGMRAAYDQVHSCHGKACRVDQGNDSFKGIVLGVTERGELRVRGAHGERHFNGGEVSLRRSG